MVAGVGKNAILTSKDDGKTWTGSKSANSVFKIASLPIVGVVSGAIDVAWNGSIWVAAGGGKNAIATSKDGITWTASKSANSVFKVVNVDLAPVTAECSGVAWNGSLWVAASTAGKNAIATSKDGITWTASKSANSIFKFPGTALHGAIDVAWNGKLWVAVGIGKNAIATSKDGKTWKASKSANSVFDAPAPDAVAECSSVAWNGSLWVAASVAKNAIGTSKDGITWTASKSANSIFKVPGADISGAIDVAWNGSLWVAVGIGKNTIATSKDGKTWTASKNSIFKKNGTTKYEGCLGVAWNGSYWVAVGAGVSGGEDDITKVKGKIATSKDGKTWTLSKTEKLEVYISVQSKVSNYPPY
jgi:hypothetical protein